MSSVILKLKNSPILLIFVTWKYSTNLILHTTLINKERSCQGVYTAVCVEYIK